MNIKLEQQSSRFGRPENKSARIVDVLIENQTLVKDWEKFFKSLKVSKKDMSQWSNIHKICNINDRQLFTNIIERWMSEKGNEATIKSLCKTLRKIKNKAAAEALEEEFDEPKTGENSPLKLPLCFNVGQVNKPFMGRQKELDELQPMYINSKEKITLISGLGGIGKTELAKRLAHDLHKSKNANCTWFDGETAESLNQSLFELAEKTGIKTSDAQGRERKVKDLFTDLTKCLRMDEGFTYWVVIFDNVTDPYPFLSEWLELLCKTDNTFTILTSRNRKLAGADCRLISLEEWDKKDAIEFVTKSVTDEDDFEDLFKTPTYELIHKLCDRLQYHPLGIQQAVAYIIQQKRNSLQGESYSIHHYLEELDTGGRHTSQILDHKLSDISNKYTKTVFLTNDITIVKIKETQGETGKLACEILNLIAYFEPIGIPLDFLKKTVENGISGYASCKDLFESAVELLKAYSLVKAENLVISVHRLVQDVLRLKIGDSVNEESLLLVSLIEGFQNFGRIKRSELPHVLTVWKHCSRDDNLIRKSPVMPDRIFNLMLDLGLYMGLSNFTSDNYTLLEKVLGGNARETLVMKCNKARALDQVERNWPESLDIYAHVLEEIKSVFGEEHDTTLATVQNMAGVLTYLEKFEQAKELFEKVLEVRKRKLGEDHVDTIETKHNIAYMLARKGELNPAMEMLKEVLKGQEQKLGKTNAAALRTRLNLAICHYGQKKYLEAKSLFRDVFKQMKENLGEEHPLTLKSMYWFGLTLSQFPGKEGQSLDILRRVLHLNKNVLGLEHSYTKNAQEKINEIQERIDQYKVNCGLQNNLRFCVCRNFCF